MTPKKLVEKVKKLNKILEVGTKGRTTEEMVVYKKVKTRKGYGIATLLIPKGARVCHEKMWDWAYRFTAAHARSRDEKCRASMAKVLEIQAFKEPYECRIGQKCLGKKLKHGVSMYRRPLNWGCQGPRMPYRVGRMVYPDSFDSYPGHSCSNGIHFFTTIEEAMAY
jgi:hypothetical protein